jgi:C4-dicarboxylate transporter, DctM subunit
VLPKAAEFRAAQRPPPRLAGRLENLLLIVALAALCLIPLSEVLLRRLAGTGIEGATSLAQHLTLAISVLGALVAAREDRLLALGSGELLAGTKLKGIARLIALPLAAVVAVLLAKGGFEFVRAEQDSGQTLVYGLPLWWAQAIIPLAFVLIALRLALNAATGWFGRLSVLAAVLLASWALGWIGNPQPWVAPAFCLLLVGAAMGTPIFAILGGAAMILFWADGTPISVMALNHYQLVINPTLPAIPLFTLAGYLLAGSKAPQRLIRVFQAIFGRHRGGAAIVTVAAGNFFAAFTGASGVTILALGGLFLPLLLAARFQERHALALITGSGSLGALLPPALPLILYAVVAQIRMQDLFLASLGPALLLMGLTLGWALTRAPAQGVPDITERPALGPALWEAKWELALPVIAFTALFSGISTPVEAAALTAFYAFISQTFIHKDLRLTRDLPTLMVECGLLVGGILVILGMALGLTNYLVDAQVPDAAAQWISQTIHSPMVFLLVLNGALVLAGALMNMYSAIVVLVPLLAPIAHLYQIDPLHLGVIFLSNMELGYLMPLVGMNLFFAAHRFGKRVTELFVVVLPMLLMLAIGVLLITFIPAISTWLPGLVR